MERKLNRRRFLKVSAQGAAVASLTSVNTVLSMPGSVNAQTSPKDHKDEWINSLIRDFIVNSPLNTLQNATSERAFEEPLVGLSRGDDSIFELYKDRVGPFHWTPLEIFQLSFPEVSVKPDELAVISWILPQTTTTKVEHRKAKKLPTERWARARIFGEMVNDELRKHVVERLSKSGFQVVAPLLSPLYKMQMSEKYGFASTWSERHVAYASGLGTFGLCDGLITPKGKAMRVGSVVAKIQLPVTTRPYDDHHAYCLFYSMGTCGVCISRCPSGALSKEKGHDKRICAAHLQTTRKYVASTFGFEGYGCGLCQTGVPCESQIPVHSSL
jgi:hypothetical protein